MPAAGPRPQSRSARRPRAFRVALAIPHAVPFLERFLVGVSRHARLAGWTFVRMPERIDPSIDWLSSWDGDGALIAAHSDADLQIARTLSIPVVNILSQGADDGLPLVSLDHEAVGRLAARHLRQRGFTNLAFYGVKDRHYSDARRDGFCAALAVEGLTPLVLEADARSPKAWLAHQAGLERWLATLPAPVGVFASTDERAVEVLEICHRLGRAVPGEVAVLGVDDDPVLCEFARPPLSSIARDDFAAGTAAATMLQRMMEARLRGLAPRGPTRQTIAPVGVVERQSTAIYAVSHPQVAALVARIERDYAKPLTVASLMAGLPKGRRRLEDLFRAELGMSPYQFVLRTRLRHAKELLQRQDGRTLTSIATACGFSSLRHFRVAQKREGC